MRNILILLGLIVTITCCKKPLGDDLSGSLELKGVLSFIDSLRGNTERQLLKKTEIKISYENAAGDPSFLYKTVSKEDGTFSFTNLSNRNYKLTVETEINGLLFSGTLIVNPENQNNIQFDAYPDVIKNNILYIVTRTKTNGERLNGSSVCLFTNSLLAAPGTCTGSIKQATSDSYGRVYFLNLLPGTYYINTQNTLGPVTLSKKTSITIDKSNGFYSIPVFLE